MMEGINLIAENLGVAFELIITLITNLGLLVFFTRDFKIGMVLMFILNGGLFMWFYAAGYNYLAPVVLFFMALIIMALTLYPVSKKVGSGGVIG